MKRSGNADLPLHYGHVPPWLAERMGRLSLAITESVISDYGVNGMLQRLSDPFWFQSFGAVMGMDWHSSGITTSVLGALKRAINPLSKELGIYVCGGKGKASKNTPAELRVISEKTGMNGDHLVRCSKLSAKVDNTAVQDGFQLYLHTFILANTGEWSVVQQGMRDDTSTARRYHWHSEKLRSFVEEPHTGVCGRKQGLILNMTASEAAPSRDAIMSLKKERPELLIGELRRRLIMPAAHELSVTDVDMKRLGSMLWLTHDQQPQNFEELLLLQGLGPRTLQSLALVSEVIHGTPSRFSDPARFAFAHGGKDGHPFPVPLKTYDETISTLNSALHKSKLGASDKHEAIKKLSEIARKAEENFITGENHNEHENFEALIGKEKQYSWKYGGRTVLGVERRPVEKQRQLRLF